MHDAGIVTLGRTCQLRDRRTVKLKHFAGTADVLCGDTHDSGIVAKITIYRPFPAFNQRTTMRTPLEVLKDIVTDVNAMRLRDDEFALTGTGGYMDDDRVGVYWPNLDILVKEAEMIVKHKQRKETE